MTYTFLYLKVLVKSLIDIESYQKTINAINLAKLLSFGEKDIKNGNVITHENAKKIFEKTLAKSKRQ
jgi:hypothetical protein